MTCDDALVDRLVPVDVDAFLRSLVDEGIISWSPEAPAAAVDVAATAITRAAYRPPQIDKHDDLEELLLLDPIHDIGPEGWPAAG